MVKSHTSESATPIANAKADEWDNKPTVELDAIAPNRLRELLERHLSGHLRPPAYINDCNL
jgi:hypothetical protein